MTGGVEALREAMTRAGFYSVPSEHIDETPERVFRFWQEFINPDVDLAAILKSGFSHDGKTDTGAMVVQTNIPFRGLCAHHLLPFVGKAVIGYIPNERVVGLSKMARLTDKAGTKMPSTQETITNLIADVMNSTLNPLGVIVVTEATHMCMAARGIKAPTAITKVSAIRGLFIHSPTARQEFFEVVNLS